MVVHSSPQCIHVSMNGEMVLLWTRDLRSRMQWCSVCVQLHRPYIILGLWEHISVLCYSWTWNSTRREVGHTIQCIAMWMWSFDFVKVAHNGCPCSLIPYHCETMPPVETNLSSGSWSIPSRPRPTLDITRDSPTLQHADCVGRMMSAGGEGCS